MYFTLNTYYKYLKYPIIDNTFNSSKKYNMYESQDTFYTKT